MKVSINQINFTQIIVDKFACSQKNAHHGDNASKMIEPSASTQTLSRNQVNA